MDLADKGGVVLLDPLSDETCVHITLMDDENTKIRQPWKFSISAKLIGKKVS